MRIVFDTNVIVSAFIARGSSFEVFKHCLSAHRNFISQHIFDEVEGVLVKKFSFPSSQIAEVLRFLSDHLEYVEVTPIEEPICRDPSDDLVLGCAKAARADCLLTGDEDLLILERFESTRIIKPSDFWRFEKGKLK
ncbi:MAG: putative toxin-antitoxin system toxin component, PIN family [Actinomycetota bacterium]|nr:putative toxin-antitoxin system toxin component, PIN family [Actinomycetota bacterium]